MNGANYSVAFRSITVPTSWKVAGSADFDGDGRGDLFWFNPSTGQTSIWLMNGTGSPNATYTTRALPRGGSPANLGDYNGNGRGDVFWRNPSSGQTRVWLMNSGSIASQFDSLTVPLPWKVVSP